MHRTTLLTALLLLTSCDKKSDEDGDDTGGIPGVDPTCDAFFNLTQADGSELSFGACARQGVQGAFEEDPDETPQMREIDFIFRGGGSDDADCWVRWQQVDLCGSGYYPIDELGTLKWKTADCPGLPSTGKDSVSAITGYAHVWAMATRVTASGETELIIQTVIQGTAEDGTSVSGAFQLTETLPTTVAESTGCIVSSGDDDADGYVSDFYGGKDCDDTNVIIHPGGLETCDGVDEDCDGKVDEGLEEYPWYDDEDSDGFGADETEVMACDGQEPDGYVGQGNDCDDSDPNTNPAAPEICDDLDNDCDTVADEGGVCDE
jgi:hypothetical protein